MQSQQKKVKWSRGETADALEERTDTGITQVSVSKLENIVADIYGNISRRPALKIVSTMARNTQIGLQHDGDISYDPDRPPFTFVFTITDEEYVIFVAGVNRIKGFLIRNNICYGVYDILDPITDQPYDFGGGVGYSYGLNASFAQSNNWGVLSNVLAHNYVHVIRLDQTSEYKFYAEKYTFSAPWYAPNGTNTYQVTSSEVAGLNFSSASVGNYTYTEANGETTVYSWIRTGIAASGVTATWDAPTTTFYTHGSAGIDTTGPGTASWTMTNGTSYYSGQVLVMDSSGMIAMPVELRITRNKIFFSYRNTTYDVTSKFTNVTIPTLEQYIPAGSIVQFPNNGAYMRVEGYDSDGTQLRMYGSFLTPIADDNAHDTIVKVEGGYISLQNYFPTTFTFSQQRLYASGWTYNVGLDYHQLPGYVVGSQIGRFTDFKNDYNLQNEAVVIDINTQYQEKVNYVADYNGVKIFTTASEYAYSQQNGVVKQSTNGSSQNVTPTTFGSTLLYFDKTEKQLRALQYEFQTDIFQSNVLNQMCQEDLINSPISLSTVYDKTHHTGSFIYVVQKPMYPNPDSIHVGDVREAKVPIAVCNFVPGNQAEIWARWTVPTMELNHIEYNLVKAPVIVNSITVNNKTWFILHGLGWRRGNLSGATGYSLAELDYDSVLDFEIKAQPTDTKYSANRGDIKPMISLNAWESLVTGYAYTNASTTPQVGDDAYDYYGEVFGRITETGTTGGGTAYINVENYSTGVIKQYLRNSAYDRIVTDLTFPNSTVSVFDGDKYMWDDTLDSKGNYTKSLAELTDPRVGFMINATLESHPIDIQGKTYTEKKRIGKCVAVIRNTDSGAFTVCDKTGYTAIDKKTVNFYGCTGMKDLIRYTIKNIQGAKFTIESLTMIVEYGTLDS